VLKCWLCVVAIKTGRYTHAKKARDITEVKLMLAHQNQQQHRTPASQDNADDVSLSDTVSTPSDLSPVHAAWRSDTSSPAQTVQLLQSDELDNIIHHITNVHLSQTPLTPDFVAALPEREKHYLVNTSYLLYA